MNHSVRMSGWLLTVALAAAPLAIAQQKSAPAAKPEPQANAQEKKSAPAAAKPSALAPKAADKAAAKTPGAAPQVKPVSGRAPGVPAPGKPAVSQPAAAPQKPSTAQGSKPSTAQGKPSAMPAKPAPSKAAAKAPAASATPNGVTRSAERRDPFQTLIRESRGQTPQVLECGQGVRSIQVGQAEVNGIVKSPAGYIAVVSVGGSSPRTYFLREGTVVCNGIVQAITPESIVFVESVLDPMGKAMKREVIKKIPVEAK